MRNKKTEIAEGRDLPVLPLRNLVIFPGVVLPVDVGRAGSLRLVEDVAARQPSRLVLATQRDPQIEDPRPEDLYPIGVEAEVLKVVKLGEGRLTVVMRAIERRKLGPYVKGQPYVTEIEQSVEESEGK